MIMPRYIRFHSEKQQINLLNCGKLDEWKDTCYNRQGAFIDVCSGRCKCDIYQDDRAIKWELDPNDYMCVNNDKWSVEKEYVLLNHVWTPTGNKRNVNLIEAHSRDCFVPQCDYISNGETICVGYDKYDKKIKRCTKYEGGYDYYPEDFKQGELIEKNSTDCGFDPTSDLIFEYSGDTPMNYIINNVEYTTEFSPLAINTKTKLGIDTITSMKGLFYQKSGHRTNNITRIVKIPNTSNVTNMGTMFDGCRKLTTLDVSSFDTSKVTSMAGMFSNCSSLTNLDLSNFNTSKVTDMGYMFNDCLLLTTLDVSNFDTSKVTSMYSMFTLCLKLTSLNISNFDTSNVVNMGNMFTACELLTTLDVSNFDTSKVTKMGGMFDGCRKLTTLDVSNFDTSKVTDMHSMFGCELLTTLDVSNFDTSKVTSMVGMFDGCRELTSLNLSSFNTSKVTDMSDMFNSCLLLTTLDLSNFDTSKVTNMHRMFFRCRKLTSLNLSSFNTSKVTDMSIMFTECNSLKTIYMRNCSQSTIDKIKAALTQSEIPDGQVTIITQ